MELTEVQQKILKNIEGLQEIKYTPIIRPQTKEKLLSLIDGEKPINILEIGTLYGYSGSYMLLKNKNAFLTTLEINKEHFDYATNTFKSLNLINRVEQINIDAINFLQDNYLTKKYDLIFLDGPKGQYVKYLPYLTEMLNNNGILFADDIMYYGLVESENKIIHKHRSIVVNLRKFIAEATNSQFLKTEISHTEDGYLIATKL